MVPNACVAVAAVVVAVAFGSGAGIVGWCQCDCRPRHWTILNLYRTAMVTVIAVTVRLVPELWCETLESIRLVPRVGIAETSPIVVGRTENEK